MAHATTFIGVCITTKRHMKIIKDEATGKFAWYASCAALHTEFMKRMQADPSKYKGCDFYAISGLNYLNNKLMINAAESAKITISAEALVVLNAVELNFHKKASIGMFMPIQFNLEKVYDKIKNDPSQLFAAASRAKDLIFNESKPCTSCGTLCHVPDMSDHPEMSSAMLKDIMDITSDNKHFCFNCGRTIMINMAKHKMEACSDFVKINKVTELVVEFEKFDLSNTNFDFDRAQHVMRELMHCISKTNVTVVKNDKVIREEDSGKPNKTKLTKPQDIPNWLN